MQLKIYLFIFISIYRAEVAHSFFFIILDLVNSWSQNSDSYFFILHFTNWNSFSFVWGYS